MTREEAMQRLSDLQDGSGQTYEAIRMAIEALSERNIARDIATILENEQDMRVILQNEVVRCKDCKWYECGGLPCPIDLCESLGDDGFCSRGERKEK